MNIPLRPALAVKGASMLNGMEAALSLARKAAEAGEVPVGAVIAQAGRIIASSANRVETKRDPTAHAEMLVIRAACRQLDRKWLEECDLYVTLEPCAMCAQAIAHARLRRVYYGAYDPKGGAIEHGPRLFSQPTCHHRPEIVGGVQESECAALLKDFFAARR